MLLTDDEVEQRGRARTFLLSCYYTLVMIVGATVAKAALRDAVREIKAEAIEVNVNRLRANQKSELLLTGNLAGAVCEPEAR